MEGSYADHYTTDAPLLLSSPRRKTNPPRLPAAKTPSLAPGWQVPQEPLLILFHWPSRVPTSRGCFMARPDFAICGLGPRGLMDKASDFGSEDCRFESCRGRQSWIFLFFFFLFPSFFLVSQNAFVHLLPIDSFMLHFTSAPRTEGRRFSTNAPSNCNFVHFSTLAVIV